MKTISLFTSALIAFLIPMAVAEVAVVAKPAPLGADAVKRPPFSMAGQVIFRSGQSFYQGSGTVVYTRSVLTAAHNVWDPVNGWSTGIQFNRARSGTTSASSRFASRLFVFGTYRTSAAHYGQDSIRTFASDLGGLRFNVAPASGAYAGWRSDSSVLASGAQVLCLGYGAEFHSGDEMLAVRAPAAFTPVFGAFMESSALTFEGGMSGGPVLTEVAPDDYRVVGVIVAGSDTPPAAGIRALDAAGAAFIAGYLRY